MNPLGSLCRAGVPLAFGTDAPLTPIAGWALVRAAAGHTRPGERLSPVDALAATTSGGHWAGRIDRAGTLEPGALASFAVWDVRPASAPAVPDLPVLEPGSADPECVLTVASGRIVFRSDAELDTVVYEAAASVSKARADQMHERHPDPQMCRWRCQFMHACIGGRQAPHLEREILVGKGFGQSQGESHVKVDEPVLRVVT